jgi:hypothetical protein
MKDSLEECGPSEKEKKNNEKYMKLSLPEKKNRKIVI